MSLYASLLAHSTLINDILAFVFVNAVALLALMFALSIRTSLSKNGVVSPGTGSVGAGGSLSKFSDSNFVFVAYSLCQSAFDIDFLSNSSIIISKPSLPEKKINGMWQHSKIKKLMLHA